MIAALLATTIFQAQVQTPIPLVLIGDGSESDALKARIQTVVKNANAPRISLIEGYYILESDGVNVCEVNNAYGLLGLYGTAVIQKEMAERLKQGKLTFDLAEASPELKAALASAASTYSTEAGTQLFHATAGEVGFIAQQSLVLEVGGKRVEVESQRVPESIPELKPLELPDRKLEVPRFNVNQRSLLGAQPFSVSFVGELPLPARERALVHSATFELVNRHATTLWDEIRNLRANLSSLMAAASPEGNMDLPGVGASFLDLPMEQQERISRFLELNYKELGFPSEAEARAFAQRSRVGSTRNQSGFSFDHQGNRYQVVF